MKNEKLMVNHLFDKGLRSGKNCMGLESGPERGGIGSVIELATAK